MNKADVEFINKLNNSSLFKDLDRCMSDILYKNIEEDDPNIIDVEYKELD